MPFVARHSIIQTSMIREYHRRVALKTPGLRNLDSHNGHKC